MASRSSSWLLVGSLALVVTAASASCGSDKKRPPSLTSGTTTSTTTTTAGAGGSGGDATGGAGGTGGIAGGTGTGGMPDTCTNKEKDGEETDVDCGGPCAGCGTGKTCLNPTDCISKNCSNGACAQPSCSDGIQNQGETDIDCGPAVGCAFCGPGKKCNDASDCLSAVCKDGVCAKEACDDGVLNGSETDIDCGGAGCPHCTLNKKCVLPSDCVTNTCNSVGGLASCVCPLGMVVVPINGGGAYCMDATEVTYLQYQEFHSAGIQAATQPASCLPWNMNFTPTANWSNWAANGKGSFPVTNVNWCDAYMYCQFKGKHLCGKIGGGPNDPANFDSPDKSEWFNACSAQGTNTYPYGSMYMPGICNGESCLGTLAESDSSIKLCEGGQPMLQQMSGNAAEWEDSCDASAGQSDACRVRGGSNCSNANGLRCDADVKHARNFSDDQTGFRCCL